MIKKFKFRVCLSSQAGRTVGVIIKVPRPRPYRYRIHNDLLHELSQDELLDLYDFIDVMSNTQVPSVQGYLLRDGLKKHMNRTSLEPASKEQFLSKYHYLMRRISLKIVSFYKDSGERSRKNRSIRLFSKLRLMELQKLSLGLEASGI